MSSGSHHANSRTCWYTLLLLLLLRYGPAPADAEASQSQRPVWPLHAGEVLEVAANRGLETFCYAGEPPRPTAIWRSAWLSVQIGSDSFAVYRGDNATHVADQQAAAAAQIFQLLPWRARHVRLPPFADTCVGVDTTEPYRVQLHVRSVDYSLLLLLAAGLTLFCCAPTLSTNVVFHYSSGVAVGMFGALLVAVYILSRMVPRRSGALAFLFTGWSLALYLLQYVLENLHQYVLRYKSYVLGYLTVSGLISFAICYWFGPVKDQRTQTLIKWFLQLVGLVLVYLSSSMSEASMGVVLLLAGWQCLPEGVGRRLRKWLHRRLYRPRPRRLLTEEEYLDQTSEVTRRALEQLREHCRSPDCDAWRTVSRLRTPQRFADFVGGTSHLSDDELLEYELEPTTLLPSDGETSDEDW